MLLSMTGYGRFSHTWADKTFTVEIRSLNSKFTDLRLKCMQNLHEKDAELRRIILDFAQRGKLEVNIEVKSMRLDDELGINTELFSRYFLAVQNMSKQFGYQDDNLMSAILRLPNVVTSGDSELSDEEWEQLHYALDQSLERFNAYRLTEGRVLADDMRDRVAAILELLGQVTPFEEQRIVTVRERLRRLLDEHMNKENIDENRFEQELLFYLEKMDITEEKVRLSQHCKYFNEVIDSKKDPAKGRKLNFISQEIGREINTLGSKANSPDIQRLVVNMKDELEKIKEQIANIV